MLTISGLCIVSRWKKPDAVGVRDLKQAHELSQAHLVHWKLRSRTQWLLCIAGCSCNTSGVVGSAEGVQAGPPQTTLFERRVQRWVLPAGCIESSQPEVHHLLSSAAHLPGQGSSNITANDTVVFRHYAENLLWAQRYHHRASLMYVCRICISHNDTADCVTRILRCHFGSLVLQCGDAMQQRQTGP